MNRRGFLGRALGALAAIGAIMLTNNEIKAIAEAKARAMNALALFRPLPHQEKFLKEMTMRSVMECLLSGGNRSGKSVTTAVWMASLLLDQPIITTSGEEIWARPARWRGEAMLVWGVGYDWKHIGETLYRLLFKAGAFNIIKDKGKWRAYDPVLDKDREDEKRKAPPLIPNSAIEPGSWDWENKKAKQLHSVTFKADGTRMVFYPSTAEVAQGNPVHVIWIDESIENDGHYAEWQMRVSEHEGKIIWTTWPTTEPSGAMLNLKERGELQRGDATPSALFHQFKGSDNPHTQNAHREAALASMSPEERAARDAGTFMMDGWLMYPRYSRGSHNCLKPHQDTDDRLSRAVREANGIPLNWTRYLALDPGTAHPAVLLLAVPPPAEFGDYVVPYKEFYPGRADADQLARLIRNHISPEEQFENFIIDWHAGRQVAPGLGHTIADNYSRAFREYGLRSFCTGSGFVQGIDIPETRIGMLQNWLVQRRDGTCKLRIYNKDDCCRNLCDQLERYRRQAGPDRKPTDKPAKSQQIDVATCLEYLAGYQPTWINRPFAKPESSGLKAWNAFVNANTSGVQGNAVHCGPGAYGSA